MFYLETWVYYNFSITSIPKNYRTFRNTLLTISVIAEVSFMSRNNCTRFSVMLTRKNRLVRFNVCAPCASPVQNKFIVKQSLWWAPCNCYEYKCLESKVKIRAFIYVVTFRNVNMPHKIHNFVRLLIEIHINLKYFLHMFRVLRSPSPIQSDKIILISHEFGNIIK